MDYQPWFRAFADLPERKAHYSDAQFRALVELWCATASSRTPGTFPSLAAVRRVVGDIAHFLIEQDDIHPEEDGSVSVVNWSKYQRPFDRTHADRQARYRERQRDESDASSDASRDASSDEEAVNRDIRAGRDASRDGHTSSSLHRHFVSSTSSLSSSSSSTEGASPAPARTREGYPDTDTDADLDALDDYHRLTGWRPWGQFSGDKLRGAIAEYGNDTVSTALEVEAKADGDRKTLLDRALARLARDAERRARSKPKPERVRRPAVDQSAYDAARRELSVLEDAG